MATAPAKATGEPVAFSYAQAAKGISSSGTSTAASSKPASGSMTPSKDQSAASASIPTVPSGMNWAEDGEGAKEAHKSSNGSEALVNGVSSGPVKQPTVAQQDESSSTSSQEMGTSSSSTLVKEDDASSVANAGSESTWENKSQVSNSIEKSEDPKAHKGGKKAEKEKLEQRPLQEAPIPSVNIWKQRADQAAKAKATLSTASPKSGTVTSTPPSSAGLQSASEKASGPSRSDLKKKSKTSEEAGSPAGLSKETRYGVESSKSRDEEKGLQSRPKSEHDERVRRSSGANRPEKDDRNPTLVPLPPVRDQESWPTPESAQDEERKRAQEKGEKSDKDRSSSAPSARSHGKNEWVPVPYTPTVVFNTPLPNTNPRRGGRGGSRGGAQSGSRGGSYAINGVVSGEKDPAAGSLQNGDQPKRGRAEGGAVRDSSPGKSKRAASAGSASWRDAKHSATSFDRSVKAGTSAESGATSARQGSAEDNISPSSAQSIAFPRQHPKGQKQGRRYDTSNVNERKRDGDFASPSHENTSPTHGRRTSTATQTEEFAKSSGNDGQSKAGAAERRGGPFGSFSGRDRGESRGRGGMRGGRGGAHGYQNAHHANGHQFTNGHPAPLQTSSSFPLPRSPTSFHPEQANTFFMPTGQHSRAYRGNGPRSQSIPTEAIYGRATAGYPAGPQPVAPVQPYMGAMYDYAGQPMSAVPYTPYMDQYVLLNLVTTQLEYYFSVDNLCKDMFLRKHMDSKGFVFLGVIADFNRIKQLTTDMELIKMVCYQSRTIEFRIGADGKDRLRRREGWEQWVLSMGDRDPSAQNDGPAELHHPPIPHPQGFDPQIARYPPTSPGSVPLDASYQALNGMAASVPVTGSISNADHSSVASFAENGTASNTISPTATSYQPSAPLSMTSPVEPDSFSDEQVENLSVIVRKQEAKSQGTESKPAASRTFSNGSIDSRSIADELHKFDTRQGNLQANGQSPVQGDIRRRSETPSRSFSPSFNKFSNANPLRLYWVKGKDTPVDSMPEDSTYESYTELRSKALEQRQTANSGTCPYDMDVLYQFWSHFLIRNFNTNMYNEFRRVAFDDAHHKKSDVGLKNLLKYYGESLSSQYTIRERIARHYVGLVVSEDASHDRPAFKQLRSAWRNGALNLKNRKKIGNYMDAELKAALEV